MYREEGDPRRTGFTSIALLAASNPEAHLDGCRSASGSGWRLVRVDGTPGRGPAQGCNRSNAAASRRTSPSRGREPTRCSPIGKPFAVPPQGTATAG
jgi:hypothetical protein